MSIKVVHFEFTVIVIVSVAFAVTTFAATALCSTPRLWTQTQAHASRWLRFGDFWAVSAVQTSRYVVETVARESHFTKWAAPLVKLHWGFASAPLWESNSNQHKNYLLTDCTCVNYLHYMYFMPKFSLFIRTLEQQKTYFLIPTLPPLPSATLKSFKTLQKVLIIISIKIAYLRSQSETG